MAVAAAVMRAKNSAAPLVCARSHRRHHRRPRCAAATGEMESGACARTFEHNAHASAEASGRLLHVSNSKAHARAHVDRCRAAGGGGGSDDDAKKIAVGRSPPLPPPDERNSAHN